MIADEVLIEYIRPSTEDDLPTLRRLEQAAVAMIEKRTGRYFGPTAAITESLQWRGWPMALANDPIGGAITTFESWDGTAWSAVGAGTYYLDGRFLYWNTSFWRYSNWTPLTAPTRYRVTYNAGYASDSANDTLVPEDIKQAVLLLVGHWFENREAVVVGASSTGELPLAVSALIDGHIRAAA